MKNHLKKNANSAQNSACFPRKGEADHVILWTVRFNIRKLEHPAVTGSSEYLVDLVVLGRFQHHFSVGLILLGSGNDGT